MTDAATDSGLAELRGKSLLIFDDGLRSKNGHWFEYDKAVIELHADLGVRTTIVCHASFPHAAELEALGAEVLPLMPSSHWTGVTGGSGLFHEAKVTAIQGWRCAVVLRRLLRERSFNGVLHPSALAPDLLAWCLLPRALRERAGVISLLTRFGLGSYPDDGPPMFARKHRVWRWMTKWLRKDFKAGRIRLIVDSARLGKEYEIVSGVRPLVVPSARAIQVLPRSRDPRGRIVFGTLGAARFDKGSDIFQDAIRLLLQEGIAERARFVIQWNAPVFEPNGTEYCRDPVLEEHRDVEFIDHVLSSSEYDEVLHVIDCMVLPYRRRMYHSQISGVAVEAACAGIPLIYTEDSWLSDFAAEQAAGLGVKDGDARGLACAIREIASNYGAFKHAALERAAIARAMNSPRRFARALWLDEV